MSYEIATSDELIEIAFSGDVSVDDLLDGFEALAAANGERAKRGIMDLTRVVSVDLSIEDSHRLARARNFPWLSEYRVAVAVSPGGVADQVQGFLQVRELLTPRSASQVPAFRIFETVDEAQAWVMRHTSNATIREPS